MRAVARPQGKKRSHHNSGEEVASKQLQKVNEDEKKKTLFFTHTLHTVSWRVLKGRRGKHLFLSSPQASQVFISRPWPSRPLNHAVIVGMQRPWRAHFEIGMDPVPVDSTCDCLTHHCHRCLPLSYTTKLPPPAAAAASLLLGFSSISLPCICCWKVTLWHRTHTHTPSPLNNTLREGKRQRKEDFFLKKHEGWKN